MRAFARYHDEEVERFPDGKPLTEQTLRLLRTWGIFSEYWRENAQGGPAAAETPPPAAEAPPAPEQPK